MAFSPRKAAADALSAILEGGAYSSIYIGSVLDKLSDDVPDRDRRFFTGLVYGTLEHLPSVDYRLAGWSKIKPEKMPGLVRNSLRLALVQILYMDKIPESAAIAESVNLVKHSACKNLAPFTNAVLRSAQRAGYKRDLPSREENEALWLSIRYDMPEWIVRAYLAAYDTETTEKILRLSCGEKPLAIRTNTLKISSEELFKKLSDDSKVSEIHPGLAGTDVFYLKYNGPFAEWNLYRDGLLYAQDESSVLAALLSGASSGMRVLDLCAAPGGKSAVIAQSMKNQGVIVSRDLHPQRVTLIEDNMRRLGITCVKACAADGTDSNSVEAGAYERVILDAPCSGLGVVRGKPDIKYHRLEGKEAEELKETQRKLMETAARAVKPGGKLIYSTCTLLPSENKEQVRWFLDAHPEFSLLDAEKELPLFMECDRIAESYITLFPQPGGRDGFFAAVMEKR